MGSLGLWSTFRRDPTQGQRSLEVKLHYKCPAVTKFGGKNPWPKCNAFLGSKVIQGHLRLTRGQISQECPMATKGSRKNPWSKYSALMGQLQGQLGSTRGQILSGMLYGNQMWWEEPLTEVNWVDWVKGHVGFTMSYVVNQRTNCLRMP